MIAGLYSAGTAMDASQRQHELIAQNLAHIQMPGYRRQASLQGTLESQFSQEMKNAVNYQALGVSSQDSYSDFGKGVMEQTGHPLDVALNGEGFFVIEGPDGPLYTRNGVFQLDTEGRLVTADNLPVKGKNGEILIPNNISGSQIQITESGQVFAGGNEVGQLEVVNFENPHLLNKAGITLFQAPDTVKPIEVDPQMVQGSRERSNVSAMQELIELIAIQRKQEASQRAMSQINDAVAKHING